MPGDLGENITTRGIDLLGLGRGTKLRFVRSELAEEKAESGRSDKEWEREVKDAPCVVITGLRNPCLQIEKFRKGLQEKFIERGGEDGREIVARKAGVMSVVEVGGRVEVGMRIVVEGTEVFEKLGPV